MNARRWSGTGAGEKRTRAVTMIEVIVAMTILFMGALFAFKMFHLAIYASGSIGDDAVAAVIAQREIEEIRGWAYRKTLLGGYNFYNEAGWIALNDVEKTDPAYPQFTIRLYNTANPIDLPFSGFPSSGKVLMKSARKVKVDVTWVSSSLPRKISLVTTVGEPRPDSALVKVTPSGTTLDPHESAVFTAKCLDGAGNVIPNVPFHWHCFPMTGNGTCTPSATQMDKATLTNRVERLDGAIVIVGGRCRIYAVAKVAGEEIPGFATVHLRD